MREQLRDRRRGDAALEAGHILPDGVVEPQLSALAQAQDAGRGEALGMRGDAKTVTRRERLAAAEIGEAQGPLPDELAAMRDRGDAAGPLVRAHLEVEPLRNVVERSAEPAFHPCPPKSSGGRKVGGSPSAGKGEAAPFAPGAIVG